MQPLISVIVPVYNVEKYLEECINSIINQTYKNLEIILIDDGSTDKSGEICDEFATQDNRIVVIHKENGGLSSARNAGLDIMQGEYLSFIDSDDMVDENLIQTLFLLIEKYKTKIAICGYDKFSQNSDIDKIKEKNLTINDDFSYTPEEVFNESLKVKTFFTKCAWRNLVHKSIYQNLRFPVGENYEDVAVFFDVFNQSNTAFTYKNLYFYRFNLSSISNTFKDSSLVMIKNVRKFATSVENAYPNLKNKAIAYKCNSALNMAFLIVAHKSKKHFDTLYDLHKFVRQNLNSDFFKMQGNAIYRDILMILFYISPKLLYTFVNTIKSVKNIFKR